MGKCQNLKRFEEISVYRPHSASTSKSSGRHASPGRPKRFESELLAFSLQGPEALRPAPDVLELPRAQAICSSFYISIHQLYI